MKNRDEWARERPWRKAAGRPHLYDAIGAIQLTILTFFGLREWHSVLEIGCGSLRAGRFLIPYLDKGKYHGVEPYARGVEHGLEFEVGNDCAQQRGPSFTDRDDFGFHAAFGKQFDYLLSYSVLTHLPPISIGPLFAEASRVMRDGSIFLGTALIRAQESIVSETEWTGMPCNFFSLERLQFAARDAGLHLDPICEVYQDWFVAYKTGSDRITAAVDQMQRVDWAKLVHPWAASPEWTPSGS